MRFFLLLLSGTCLFSSLVLTPVAPATAASVSAVYPIPQNCAEAEEFLAGKPNDPDRLIDLAVCAAVGNHPNNRRVLQKIDAALKASPQDVRLHVLGAMIYGKMAAFEWTSGVAAQNYAEAEKRFQQAALAGPEEGYVWFERARFMQQWAKNADEKEDEALQTAAAYCLEALKRAPADPENWGLWRAVLVERMEKLDDGLQGEFLLQAVREPEDAVSRVLVEAVPTPKGFVFNRDFLRELERSVPETGEALEAPRDRTRSRVCFYMADACEKLVRKAPAELREELSVKAYAWYARAVLEDPSDLRAWTGIEPGRMDYYPYAHKTHLAVYPEIIAATKKKLDDPAWPGDNALTDAERSHGLGQKDLRARVIRELAQKEFPAGRRLSFEDEKNHYNLLKQAVQCSPENLACVARWFDGGTALWANKELSKAEKKALRNEMSAMLEQIRKTNMRHTDKVAYLAGMRNTSPAEVRKDLTLRWDTFSQKLKALR